MASRCRRSASWFALLLIPLLCALLPAVAPRTASAQGTTSRVTGVVQDDSGGVIPGAMVTLTNEGTGVSFTTVTTDAGAYTFEAVQVGSYSLKVELASFKAFVSTANRVAIGQTTTINARLQAGDLSETIEVVSTAPAVQVSDSGNYGAVIDQKSIESLPIIGGRGRNPLDLVKTQPGVVSGANTGGGTHVHGARDRAWNFTLDGIDSNESSAGGANFSPLRTNPDALAEFKVLTGNFTAEYGRNSGGQVAMITRSGTNELHGSGFYFARRPTFNANEWENNAQLLGKREENINIGGFSLGGPIRRQKTFFFTNLQVLRAKREITTTRTVYTEQARQGLWRYVPGGRIQPAGVPGASVDMNGNPIVPIATYNIPANDPQRIGLDPTTQAIIAKTPLPNNFTVGDGLNRAGYTFKPVEEEKQYDFIVKVDQVLGTRHYAFARVGIGEQNTYCDSANGGLQTFPGLSCLVDTTRDPINVAASWRWNPGNHFVNELVVGGNHFTFDFITPEAAPGLVDYEFGDLTMPQGFQIGNGRTINTYQIVNNTTYVRGAHAFKAGVNFRYQQHKDVRGSVTGANVNPIIDFDDGVNTVDRVAFNLPGNIQTANDLPDLQDSVNFLLGRVGQIRQGFVARGDTYAPAGTPFIFDARFPELDLFIQDNWKMRPNLTLDLGLRWEGKYTPRDPDGLTRRPNLRVAVGEAPSSTLSWVQEPLYDNDLNNFSPSVGVAWDPGNDGKSVIRGNYRIAYDRINTFLFSSVVYQSIPGITNPETNTAFGQAGGRLPNAPTLSPSGTPADFLTPPVNRNVSNYVVDPTWDSPLTHSWAFSYQRELWSRAVLEVAYIGRDAKNLYGAYGINQAEIRNNGFLDAFNTVRGGGQSALINQLMGPDSRRTASETGSDAMRRLFAPDLALGAVGSVAQALAARVQGGRTLPELAGLSPYFFYNYPQFLGGLFVLDTNDHSDYHALEVTLQRRFGRGFGYLLGYTLSRSRDTRSFDPAFTRVSTTANAQSASSTPFDIYNRDLNYGPSDFDRRHVLQGSFVTELPIGRGRRFGPDMHRLVDAAIGGWQLAGIAVISTGRPFTVYGGATTLSNLVQSPANCNGCTGGEGAVFDDPTGFKFYFDEAERAKFSTPGPGELGNTGRNAFVSAPSFNMDLSLSKSFALFDGHAFEVRADATNVTNTPTFNFPTAVVTSTTFGRIGRDVISGSRKVQLGVKYSF